MLVRAPAGRHIITIACGYVARVRGAGSLCDALTHACAVGYVYFIRGASFQELRALLYSIKRKRF